jgi:hypothetical protein
MSKQVLILDSTQVSTHYECAEKWNLGFRQSLGDMMEIDEPITMGTYGHKLLEIYYKTKDNEGVPMAVRKALQFDPDKEDKVDEKFPLSDEVRNKIKARFKDYWMNYFASDFTTLTKKEHAICINEAGIPVDTYPNKPLIEKGFSYPLFESREYLFVLEGKIDWIAQTPIGKAFIDHKFQLRERNLFPKSVQFKNYALVTGLHIGFVNYIRLKDKLDATTLIRQPLTFDAMELAWWKRELIEHFVTIAKQVKAGSFPKNWGSCSGKFGYECEFSRLCPMAPNPRMHASFKSSFIKRKEWKPW